LGSKEDRGLRIEDRGLRIEDGGLGMGWERTIYENIETYFNILRKM
jgi:hypothetical protein